jgi:hypothetical protein
MELVIQLTVGHMVFLGSDSDVFEHSITNFTNCCRNLLLFRGYLLCTNRKYLKINLKVYKVVQIAYNSLIQRIFCVLVKFLRFSVPYK